MGKKSRQVKNERKGKGFARVQRARKTASNRRIRLTNVRSGLETRISSAENRIRCLDDPAWVQQYIERERKLAQNIIERATEDLKMLRNEIAGVDIELARQKKLLDKLEEAA